MNNSIEIAFAKNPKSPISNIIAMPIKDLYNNYLSQSSIGPKDGTGWMPVSIQKGRRTADRVNSINLLVLDVEANAVAYKDDAGNTSLDQYEDKIKQVTGPTPPTFRDAINDIRTRNIACIGHTTYSHHGSFLPEDIKQERYRLIFPFNRPLEKSELKSLGYWVASMLGIFECFDHSALEPARLFYLPRCPKQRLVLFDHAFVEGSPLDADQLLFEHGNSISTDHQATRTISNQAVKGKSIFQIFNEHFTVEDILLKHGYKPAGINRWIAPQSTTGIAGVLIIPNSNPPQVYSHHTNDPLNDRRSHDAFDCMCILENNGDINAAYKKAEEMLQIQNQDLGSATPKDVENSIHKPPEELFDSIDSLPYPIDALPDVIKNAVLEVQSFIKAPFAMVASSALASATLAVQVLFDVERDNRLTGPSSLYFLTLADSGERKSTCDDFFTEPLEIFENEQLEEKKPQIKKYNAEYDAWISEKSGLQLAIKNFNSKQYTKKSGNNSTQNLEELKKKLVELELQEPLKPKVPRIIFMDTTSEALIYELHSNWPAGGLVSSEAGIIFGSHSMSKESAMLSFSLYNKLWDSGPIRIDRRTSESYLLDKARFSISLQIQEAALMEFLKKSGELARGIGFLARFLISCPISTQGTRFYSKSPENWPYLKIYHKGLKALLDLQADCLIDGKLDPQVLKLSHEAKQLWIEFHDLVEAKLGIGGELQDLRDVASKIADNAAPLACVLQAFSNPHAKIIDSQFMQSAINITSWHLNESLRFFGMIALPTDIANAKKLEQWLVKYCREKSVDSIAKTDLLRYGPKSLRKKSALDEPLLLLTEANRIWIIKNSRPVRVQIHPDLIKC